jgi:hypothetical protein
MLIAAIVINILIMILVMFSLQDIRERIVSVGMALVILSNILQQWDEPIMEAKKAKEQNAGIL